MGEKLAGYLGPQVVHSCQESKKDLSRVHTGQDGETSNTGESQCQEPTYKQGNTRPGVHNVCVGKAKRKPSGVKASQGWQIGM